MKYTKEYLETNIKKSNSFKELCLNIGVKPSNSRVWIKIKILEFKIDTSHFKRPIKKSKGSLDDVDVFIENSDLDRGLLKTRIRKQNLMEYRCQICKCDDNWQGHKMPLILDHINGINNDNRIENLRFLCSNCDSIQSTYKSKNRKK